MSIRRYLKTLWNEHRYLANWLPTRELKVGDIGIWDRDAGFSKITTLKSKDVRFRTVPGDTSGTLTSGATFGAQASGSVESATLAPDAKLTFELGAKGDFLFHAEGCTSATIDGGDAALRQLKSHLRDGLWDEDYIVITEVVTAARATIVLSESPGARFSLTGLKDRNDLVSADLSLSVEAGTVRQFLAEAGLTPLFRAWQVETTWYGTVRARPVTFGPNEREAVGGEPVFVLVEP